MSGLGGVLLADGPHASLGEHAHVFDQFVGAWECHSAGFDPKAGPTAPS